MTCADAREIILSADPGALRERTDPVLREHLEACTACSAAASDVVTDVARLRAALIARGARAVSAARPRRSKTKRVAMTLVPIALAAELAAFAFLGAGANDNPLTSRRPIIDDSVTSMVPAAQMDVDTAEAVAAAPVVKKTVEPAPKGDSIRDRDTSIAMRTIGVMPRAGQRYAVITTSDPKVTLVWLTKGDTL